MSPDPRTATAPTNRHAEKYRQRAEPWIAEAVNSEGVHRIREATGVGTERAHEIWNQHKHHFAITMDGQLKGPDRDDRGDPFGRWVTRIANMIDAEGKMPEPKTMEQIVAAQRAAVGFAAP